MSANFAEQIVRGSLLNIGGQAVTLVVSLIATPFILRLLGSEAYGVLALVNLLIGYLAFADLGMGTASTKFGTEAYARGEEKRESEIVRTALFVGLVPASCLAFLLGLLAGPIVEHGLRLPVHLQDEAVLAIRIAAIGFVARSASGVLNTPQLTRLRLGLYSIVNTTFGILQVALIPLALLLERNVITAVTIIVSLNLAAAITHSCVSQKLLPNLIKFQINRELVTPLARFGGALVITSLASMIMLNAEKVFLARYSGVTALAHYSVAVTLSGLLAILPTALAQALVPAFSRLHANNDREALQALYTRALRSTLLWIVPVSWFVCVGAGVFLTFWAGAEYGKESRWPLYILVTGVAFNVVAYIPYCLLTAWGRADWIARCHLIEVIPYLICSAVLTFQFGTIGAAVASSLRLVVTVPVFAEMVKRAAQLSWQPLAGIRLNFALAVVVLVAPTGFIAFLSDSIPALFFGCVISLAGYVRFVWIKVLANDERDWILQQTKAGRLSAN